MSNMPWFKFDVDAYLGGTIQASDMDTQGIFVNLCSRMWKAKGSIKNDDKLARLMKIDSGVLANAIACLLADGCIVEAEPGSISSKFILLQLEERGLLSMTRAEAGRKGGNAKQLNRRSKCQANGKQTPSEEEVEVEVEKEVDNTPIVPKGTVYPAGFELFWSRCRIKKSKEGSLREWKRARKKASEDDLVAGMDRLNQAVDDGIQELQYAKQPKAWLHQGGWEDQYTTQSTAKPKSPIEQFEEDKAAAEAEAAASRAEHDKQDAADARAAVAGMPGGGK